MPGLRSYVEIVLLVEALALAGLVLRLWSAGLQRVYPIFFCFVVAETIQLLVPYLISLKQVWYGYVFVVSEAVIVCFYALIVLELYSKIFGSLTGIASTARRYVRMALAAAIIISLLLLGLERTPVTLVNRFFIFERAIISSLVLFVFLITVFLLYYPIPLNRNVIVYSIGYAFYFLCKAASLFARNSGFAKTSFVSDIWLTVSTLCVLFWIIFLNRKGEKTAVVFGHRWDRGDEARLLRQLEAINASLLRTTRK